MDSKKIKLGLTLFAQKDDGTKEVIRVESMGLDGVNYDGSGKKFTYPYDKLSGIPITEKALEAIGFTYRGNLGLWENDMIGFVRIVKASDQWFTYFTKDRTSSIKYIHDVQNVYSALTGNELSIDADVLNTLYEEPVVLAAPKGLAVKESTYTSATIKWDAVPGAASYTYLLDDGDETEVTGEECELEITGLEKESNHSIRIKAKSGEDDGYADSIFSRRFKFTPKPLPLLDTPELTVTHGADWIEVKWTDDEHATEYQYTVDDGEATSVAKGVEEFKLEGLTEDKEYTISVTAIGDSDPYKSSLPAVVKVTTSAE